MMQTKSKIEPLPSEIVMASELRLQDAKIRMQLQDAQCAYKALCSLADYPMPSRLAQISVAHLDAFIENKVKSIMANDMLTDADKKQLVNKWRTFFKQAAEHINKVRTLIDENKDVQFVVDEDLQTIVPASDINTAIRKRVTKEPPALASDHWKMVQLVASVVRGLREWEAEHNINKYRLEELMRCSPQQFAEYWLQGAMSSNPELTPQQKAAREFAENQFI
jgi:hypothetical protein